jgi:hypothetical protein
MKTGWLFIASISAISDALVTIAATNAFKFQHFLRSQQRCRVRLKARLERRIASPDQAGGVLRTQAVGEG